MSAVPAYRCSVHCVLLMLAVRGYNSDAINSGLRSALQVKPLKPELNPSAQRCLTRFFTGQFAS
jgi:hypothetical protein